MLQTTTDLDLIQELVLQDESQKTKTLAILEDRHFDYCFDYLVRFGVDEPRAREVLHNLLNQLKHDPKSYQGGEDFRAWFKDKALKMARAGKSQNGMPFMKKFAIIVLVVVGIAGLAFLIFQLTR